MYIIFNLGKLKWNLYTGLLYLSFFAFLSRLLQTKKDVLVYFYFSLWLPLRYR
ncbi:hypothetical protein C4J93_3479 [Pseudomonas sp. R2-37-08W]|nr:hypothetical protein C4J93_3479 [Pseudomonas sp. R2-37-08W]